MELNADIINALKKACKKEGSQNALALKAGIKQQNISRYLKAEVKDITPKVFARIWPLIKDFLPKDFNLPPEIGSEVNSEIILLHQEKHPETNYTIYQLMHKTLCDIGADQLFFYIMTIWVGLSEKQKKKVYAKIEELAKKDI